MNINLRPIIQAYIRNWIYINSLEIYKWIAIKHFQENFFQIEMPYVERLKNSLEKTANLLVAPTYYAKEMLIEVSESKPTISETLITSLFDESKPLKERVLAYQRDFAKTIKEMAEEGHSDWYGRNNLQTFQDVHAISVYLAMRFPKKYYIYKYSIFKEFSNIVGYKIQNGNAVDRFIEFNELCNLVKKELLSEIGFISYYDNWMKDNAFDDSNYNLLTQDFIYSAVRHLGYNGSNKSDKKKPIEKSVNQIDAEEFPNIDSILPKSFKGNLNIDYAKKDDLFRSLGLLGEEWAITYEQERLKKLGIDYPVRHASVLDGDGIGYDIKSVEDDGITPRYIEVKTTTGSISQPFYYSDNELAFSELNSANYYVYRIYNFKGETQKADILIIHGSLKALFGRPVSYKVSISHNI